MKDLEDDRERIDQVSSTTVRAGRHDGTCPGTSGAGRPARAPDCVAEGELTRGENRHCGRTARHGVMAGRPDRSRSGRGTVIGARARQKIRPEPDSRARLPTPGLFLTTWTGS